MSSMATQEYSSRDRADPSRYTSSVFQFRLRIGLIIMLISVLTVFLVAEIRRIKTKEVGPEAVRWSARPSEQAKVGMNDENNFSGHIIGEPDATRNDNADGKRACERNGRNRCRGVQLSRAVEHCARSLEVAGICEHGAPQAQRNQYRVPFMTSRGGLQCGFETLMRLHNMEELSSRYTFRFVGASTTRRLAESFVSIYTGLASTHEVKHRRQDFSAGNLEVIFDWAPLCAGQTGVGKMVAQAMEEARRNATNKRLVIITAFGIHDATVIREYQEQDMEIIAPGGEETAAYRLYTEARQKGNLARDSLNTESLKACVEVTSELIQVAAGGPKPKLHRLWKGGRALVLERPARRSDAGEGAAAATGVGAETNRQKETFLARPRASLVGVPPIPGVDIPVKWDDRTCLATVAQDEREGTHYVEGAQVEDGAKNRDEGEGGQGVPRDAPVGDRRLEWDWPRSRNRHREGDRDESGSGKHVPLVFLFQGNSFAPDDRRSEWLKNLHRLQKDEVEKSRNGHLQHRDSALFLVDDEGSIYDRGMRCYRADDVHFFEPTKLVEAKMLWHLLTKVDNDLQNL